MSWANKQKDFERCIRYTIGQWSTVTVIVQDLKCVNRCSQQGSLIRLLCLFRYIRAYAIHEKHELFFMFTAAYLLFIMYLSAIRIGSSYPEPTNISLLADVLVDASYWVFSVRLHFSLSKNLFKSYFTSGCFRPPLAFAKEQLDQLATSNHGHRLQAQSAAAPLLYDTR